ncbi:MmgE/PrpD family protein, partial [Bacteroides thetaiotaomicron]
DCAWTGHPSAGAVPTGLAVAEAYHKTGKDYLTALVGGYDVYQRVAMAVQPSPERFEQGWGLHCWQIFAPTSIAGKLIGIQGDKMNQLLGTAAHMTPVAINLIHSSFSDFYHFTHGLTAQLGVENALITEAGISTLMGALEEDGGYYFGVSDQCDWDWYDKDLGSRYMIMELMLKNWPVNMWIQTPMDLIDAMVKKHGIHADDIERIEVSPYIPERSEDSPRDGYASLVRAQFSIPFCLAMYLRGPQLGWEWAEEKYLKDPVILEMAAKVHGGPSAPHYLGLCFKGFQNGEFPTKKLTITTRDGRQYSESMDCHPGHPRNMLTHQEFIERFKVQAAPTLRGERLERAARALAELEACGDIAAISPLLCGE